MRPKNFDSKAAEDEEKFYYLLNYWACPGCSENRHDFLDETADYIGHVRLIICKSCGVHYYI